MERGKLEDAGAGCLALATVGCERNGRIDAGFGMMIVDDIVEQGTELLKTNLAPHPTMKDAEGSSVECQIFDGPRTKDIAQGGLPFRNRLQRFAL